MKGSGLVRPDPSFVSALPIFPVRLQTSIFGAGELNFRVRDGNGWTLTAINTNLLFSEKKSKQKKLPWNSPGDLRRNFLLLTALLTISHYIHLFSHCQELIKVLCLAFL